MNQHAAFVDNWPVFAVEHSNRAYNISSAKDWQNAICGVAVVLGVSADIARTILLNATRPAIGGKNSYCPYFIAPSSFSLPRTLPAGFINVSEWAKGLDLML